MGFAGGFSLKEYFLMQKNNYGITREK